MTAARPGRSQHSQERSQACGRAAEPGTLAENARNYISTANTADVRTSREEGPHPQGHSQRASHARTPGGAGRGRGGLHDGGSLPVQLDLFKDQRLWTVDEVAEYLQIRPSTIRAYAERGILRCVEVGNCLRFRPLDISEWVEQR